ncbi:MAG: hypothetical protein WBH86_03655 [Thermogutta sp.]
MKALGLHKRTQDIMGFLAPRKTGEPVPTVVPFLLALLMMLPQLTGAIWAEIGTQSPGSSGQSTGVEVDQGGSTPRQATEVVGWQLTPTDTLRKQNLQQQVRQMAKRLVAERLNEQILQLEENGLTNLPLYSELREMQSHLDALVETHMKEVLLSLEQLIQAPPEKQPALFQIAREKSRNVVVQLLIERQKILRRLRIAEIEERVIRLIERETSILEKTERSLAESAVRQAASAVALKEDQQDIYTLFRGMKQSLEEIRTWGGRVGAEATAALQSLTESRVDGLFEQSIQQLSENQFAQAAQVERQIITSLEALLERVRRFQGEMESDSRDAARRMIEALAERQAELREKTLNAEANIQEVQALTENQLQLQKEIEHAAKKLPQGQESLNQAAEAARQATETLFQGQTQQATEHQQSVIDHLAEALTELQRESPAAEFNALPNSEAVRSQLADLRQAKAELQQIREEQATVSQTARQGELEEAAKGESRLSQKINDVPTKKSLPEDVTEAIRKAAETVGQSAQALSELSKTQTKPSGQEGQREFSNQAHPDHPPEAGKDDQNTTTSSGENRPQVEKPPKAEGSHEDHAVRMATRRAEQAIDEAISAVEMAIADAERARLAAELVDAVQSMVGSEGQTPDRVNLARQRAAELAQLTQQQLDQVRSTKKAVEAELPLARDPASQALQQLEKVASQAIEAAALQQEAMGREDLAKQIRSAGDMKKAIALAKEAAEHSDESNSSPAKNQSIPLQDKVTEAATEALAELARLPSLPEDVNPRGRDAAKAALNSARSASQEAAKRLATPPNGENDGAADLQRKAASNLATAAEQIHGLMESLASHVADKFGQHAQKAENLSEMAVPVHPEATSNLHMAENAAHQGSTEAGQRLGAVTQGHQGVEHGLTTAVEALAERENQLSRALSAAQNIPELLNALERQPNSVATQPSTPGQNDNPMDPAEKAMAAILAAAQQAATPQAGHPSTSHTAEDSPSTPASQAATQPSNSASADSQGGFAKGRTLESQNVASTARPLQQQTSQPNADSRGAYQQGQGVSTQPGEANLPPWLLQLPPQMREAIRSGMTLPPPKGYEDRLRRYFQNLE